MLHLNVEIKARCNHSDRVRQYLLQQNAVFKGTDEQTDTYFKAACGRLKLREGKIENNLIFYQRSNQAGPKDSHFQLVPVQEPAALKQVLTDAMGVKVVVRKIREIYFIENVKFHIDEVPGLGAFVEIEASNLYAPLTRDELLKQCEQYLQAFEIKNEDLIDRSYSDLLMEKQGAQ